MKRRCITTAMLLIFLFALQPLPADADGGPVVDPMLFAKLKEGQQVAVVQLLDEKTASIDLFVSILDQTGESHEIVYFVPLGVKAESFSVYEQDSLEFNKYYTNWLDTALFEGYRKDRDTMEMLFAGALLTNGIWFTPLWLPLLLTGCADAAAPVSTFQTESSEVSIYALDDSTDLETLIATTGLDPSVTETLTRLRGQQIAVVNLHTQPQTASTAPAGETALTTGESGLHLHWNSILAEMESGAAYAYPLGTGASWAHPIEMTRIYVIAPDNLNFTVKYPKLGKELSGYMKKQWTYQPRIADAGEEPAYAVDTATGKSSYSNKRSWNIWRVTYTNSNSAEDIIITPDNNFISSLRNSIRQAGPGAALLTGIIVALAFWLLAWRLLMPRLLGESGRIQYPWSFALTYAGYNALLFIPGAILYLAFSAGYQSLALSILALLFGAASVLIFVFGHMRKLGDSTGKTIRAFAIVTLASSGAYLLFVFGYAGLAGII